MTLQNLSKILDKYDKQLGVTEAKQLELLKGLPFYNWIDLAITLINRLIYKYEVSDLTKLLRYAGFQVYIKTKKGDENG